MPPVRYQNLSEGKKNFLKLNKNIFRYRFPFQKKNIFRRMMGDTHEKQKMQTDTSPNSPDPEFPFSSVNCPFPVLIFNSKHDETLLFGFPHLFYYGTKLCWVVSISWATFSKTIKNFSN